MARAAQLVRRSQLLGVPPLLTAALAAIVFFFVPRTMADPDIWWHLRNAQTLIATGRFITRDLYSFTAPGAPWINHEWLAELPFYLGWRLAQANGVFAVTVLIIELDMLGVFLLAWLHSRNLRTSVFAAIVAIILSTISFGPRTLLFGWLCLLIELIVLDHSTRRPSLLWTLPVLFALWVNTHGSWMIGLILLLVYIATSAVRFRCGALESPGLSGSQLRRLTLVTLASGFALFLNPYGWRLAAYPLNLAFQQKLNIQNLAEWRALDFHSPRGLTTLACLALLALLQLCSPRRWSPCELAFLFIATYSAFHYSRFLFLFAILAAPTLARSLQAMRLPSVLPKKLRVPHPSRVLRAKGRRQHSRPLLNAAILLVLLASIVSRLRHHDLTDLRLDRLFPTQALPYLATHPPQGPVFNEFLWGGYLIWNLPHTPVFIDSRTDIFEYNGTFRDYLDIIRIHNSLALLDRYNIRSVLYERDTPLVYLLQHTGGWRTTYQDARVILLERTASAPTGSPR